jgi:SagB-type dehydrogenase family enzyme
MDEKPGGEEDIGEVIKLPNPRFDSDCSVESALRQRRSIREYRDEPLALEEVSQLLWSAQGISDPKGLRMDPSAGGLYPLEVYLIAGKVNNLFSGVYKYRPNGHMLVRLAHGDKRTDLSAAALDQECIRDGAAVIVIAAIYMRTTVKYYERGIRYVDMEVGHAGQNISLQAVSMGLASVVVGAFDDYKVKRLLKLPDNEQPLYLIPVGKEKS